MARQLLILSLLEDVPGTQLLLHTACLHVSCSALGLIGGTRKLPLTAKPLCPVQLAER